MTVPYRLLRYRLREMGLLPASRLARAAWYVLGLDLLLFGLQEILGLFRVKYGESLGGWVTFLSSVAVGLFLWLGFRWLRARVLWRLRNRLIVTYVFIGVIPVVLLVTLALGSFYLFAGQFATFIVTTGLHTELASLDAANVAVAHELASGLKQGRELDTSLVKELRQSDKAWADREVMAWKGRQLLFTSLPEGVKDSPPPVLPEFLKLPFHDVVRDHDKLYLRVGISLGGEQPLTVISSEPLDQRLLQELATDLGEITLYASGLNLQKVGDTVPTAPSSGVAVGGGASPGVSVTTRKADGSYVLDTGKEPLTPTYTAGSLPPPVRSFDNQVTFATSIFVVNWATGDTSQPAAISVQTRFSKLYGRLFAALGDFAPAVEFVLLFVAIIFGVIELLALLVGVRLTRTMTRSVGELYGATQHVNRGDFSHRIEVKTKDQMAALETSFNSMTESIERLLTEQKEKQRLENELVIAQEVQAQLFPREVSQLESLEVHGFCRPARTVSGDYYDFLCLNSDKLILAVGDVSGKGISAALLMATIHSAVRAYSLEGIPLLREPVAVGAAAKSELMLAGSNGAETSPGYLLSLLNHQLFESTPLEKYATLFLGIYDGVEHTLTYSNGGHLPPVMVSENGNIRRLDRGGTVVGLFDNMNYEEGSVQVQRGEIFLAYSDGVTEPENDFGEFGEHRLVDLVRENRHLPLARISEVVTAAVDDWIGANEQPDDITLVLARAR